MRFLTGTSETFDDVLKHLVSMSKDTEFMITKECKGAEEFVSISSNNCSNGGESTKKCRELERIELMRLISAIQLK